MAALALSRGRHREVLLANPTGDTLEVAVEGWGNTAAVSVLDARSWPGIASAPDGWEAARSPGRTCLRLGAYAVASLVVAGG